MKQVSIIMLPYNIEYSNFNNKLVRDKSYVTVDYAINSNGSVEYQDPLNLPENTVFIAVMGTEPNQAQLSSLKKLIADLRKQNIIALLANKDGVKKFNEIAKAWAGANAPEYVYNTLSLYNPGSPLTLEPENKVEKTDVELKEVEQEVEQAGEDQKEISPSDSTENIKQTNSLDVQVTKKERPRKVRKKE